VHTAQRQHFDMVGVGGSSPLAPTSFSRRYVSRLATLGKTLAIAGNIQWFAACSSIPNEEKVWMVVHAVDVAQTVQIARSSCFREDDPVTRALIGEDPSVGEAVVWGVAMAGLHLGVTRMLEAWEAPGWVQGTWQALTIGNSAYFVKQNADQGIDPWGTDCH